MKINFDDKVQQSIAPQHTPKTGAPGQPTFADVLRQTTPTAAGAEKVAGPVATPPVMRPPVAMAPAEVYRSTDRMLDAMEQYQRLLGDPKTDLRGVEPALRRMQATLRDLEPMVKGLHADDPVKAVATRAMVLATKEITRFDGGGYVD